MYRTMVRLPHMSFAHRIPLAGAALFAWLTTFVFSLFTFRLLNDHFDRISRGRQIAVFGELPYRDFFDPGYFMTAFSSAALHWLFGGSLVGEMLLSASFMATGATIVLLLARRASGAWTIAWIAWLLAVLAMPRPYDFDKFLFYPLGVLLCWRYIDDSRLSRTAALGAGIVVAGLFRYDLGIIVLGAAITAVLARYARDWRELTRQAGLLALATGLAALPFLLFIHFTAGIGNAVDQVVTYAARESPRYRLDFPPFSFEGLVTEQTLAPPRHAIRIRWASSVDESASADAIAKYSLREASADESDSRTWSFFIDDVSTENLRALVTDPRVEDTSGIDRGSYSVPSEPLWTRAQRAIPLLRMRLHLSPEDASAFLYYLLLVMPVAAAVMAWRLPSSMPSVRQEQARVLSLVVMCLLLDVFILRPVEVRGGGMAGPVVVLAAWIAGRLRRAAPQHAAVPASAPSPRREWLLRLAAAIVLAITAWSESVIAEWHDRVQPAMTEWAETRNRLRALSGTPADPRIMPGRLADMARYVRECTAPEDRVFTSWFAPELSFFAQRGFAGGMAVTFSGHWSEPRFERRIIERFMQQSVPLVIVHVGEREYFTTTYPMLSKYLASHYRVAGESGFGNPDAIYQVLVPTGREPVRQHPASGMPCFI